MGHWTKCGNTKHSQNIQLWKFDHLAIWIRCWWHPSILTHLKQINKALGQWEGNDFLTETIMPVSKAMMVNPWATILPRIIFCNITMCYLFLLEYTWLPSLSFLPNLKRPFTRKKVVAPQPETHFILYWTCLICPTNGEKRVLLEFPDKLLRGRLLVLFACVSVYCQLFVQLGNEGCNGICETRKQAPLI